MTLFLRGPPLPVLPYRLMLTRCVLALLQTVPTYAIPKIPPVPVPVIKTYRSASSLDFRASGPRLERLHEMKNMM